jgi:hypothetical protein
MTGIWLIGIIVFFAAMMINRSIAASALRKLDDETKLKFIEVFTKRNNFLSLGALVLIPLFMLGMQFFPEQRGILIVGYGVALFSFMCVKFFINYKKLKEINVPPEYFRSFFTGYGIFLLGIVAVVVCGAWGTFS